MRHLLFTLLLCGGSCFPSCGQSLYVKFGGGYAFPAASHSLGANEFDAIWWKSDDTPRVLRIEEEVTGSFNSGTVPAVSVGFLFSDHIGVELHAGYVFGRKYNYSNAFRDFQDGTPDHYSLDKTSWTSRNIYAAPGLVFTHGKGRLRPHIFGGIVFSMPKITEVNSYSESEDHVWSYTREEAYSGRMAFGLRGSAGLDLKLNEKLSLFTEIAFVSMTWYPGERETVRYVHGGADMLPTMNEYLIRTLFVKSIESNFPANTGSNDQPSTALRRAFGMSSLSTLAGIKLVL